MYPVRVLKDGPAPGSKYASLDEMIMDADGFAECVSFLFFPFSPNTSAN
jgi:hypothetical protein